MNDMALLTSHFLNGTDGTHAGNVKVSLWQIGPHSRNLVFESQSEADGRFAEEIDVTTDAGYELVVESGAYFQGRAGQQDSLQICDEIVIRFRMPDPDRRYHIPIIMSPNSYSCWWSS